MIPTKGSTVVVVTAEPKVPWSRVPVAGVHNRGGGGCMEPHHNISRKIVSLSGALSIT
jgi:hypothetical protein